MSAFNDLRPQIERICLQIRERIERVIAHGQFIMGPEIAELETALADRLGVRHCLTMASGTSALEITLRALASAPATRSSPPRSPGSPPPTP